MTKPVIVIPAYQPGPVLVDLVEELASAGYQVVVVDDGSTGPSTTFLAQISDHPSIAMVRHAVNLGKGAALKTGINYALTHFPNSVGVVTADADGQHLTKDILKVAACLFNNPQTFILGARTFGARVPARSRFGNVLTCYLVYALVGRKLRDTQTGLRGIPRFLARELLRLSASGYEFELDMLVLVKHLSAPIEETPISTVYENNNASSHFQPIRDSLKIYFVLFRFALLSAVTAVIDNIAFMLAFASIGNIAMSQATGRAVAVLFNYSAARRAVFLSRAPHRETLPRYLALVVVNGFISYAGLTFFHTYFQWKVIVSKVCAEALLFGANFLLQRDFVFTRKGSIPHELTGRQESKEEVAAALE